MLLSSSSFGASAKFVCHPHPRTLRFFQCGQVIGRQSVPVSSSHGPQRLPSVAVSPQEQKALWAAGVRKATQGDEGERQTQRLWAPVLDPPAALSWLTVVLVGVKRPYSAGSVARASNCFECGDLRLVQPQCNPASERSAKRAAKGAQYILHQARPYSSLAAALEDVHYAVAFSRWDTGQQGVECLSSVPPLVEKLLLLQDKGSQNAKRVALVFGREVEGLLPEEIASCEAVCKIPIGRLQESLSLSHAVSIVLSQIYQAQPSTSKQIGSSQS
ncbi:hypothetical protein WJX74_006492 [Apatococcus lobatus]|uniref:tRNA/rRNA methyltransferase SpoU type domain-containing protein n=2 Tax=Apatococcus TaxID=904362 RepID=A0AAW1SYK4_9CHLO